MNKEKTQKHTFRSTLRPLLLSMLLSISLFVPLLCGPLLFGHDPTPLTDGVSTSNYQHFRTIFPHFAIGTSGNVNYASTIQITNSNREEKWWTGQTNISKELQ